MPRTFQTFDVGSKTMLFKEYILLIYAVT